jgi:hypothetical protein
MQVAVVVLVLSTAAAAQVEAAQVVTMLEQQTLAVAVAAVVLVLVEGREAQALSSFVMLAQPKKEQVGLSLQRVDTPITPLHLLGRIQHELLCPN